MADIFISYARDNRSKAQLLAETFEGRGWSVWWDTRLKAGEFWDEVIERELSTARCVIVLWSKTSVGRTWVRVEANEGLQRRILVPALIEDVRPPLAFRLIQTEQLFDWSGEPSHAGLNRLLDAISQCLRTQPRSVARPLSNLAVFRDIDAPWCPEMVALPMGEFLMGSPKDEEGRSGHEGPQHQVTIGRRCAIGRYPIMVGQYRHFFKAISRVRLGFVWDPLWKGRKKSTTYWLSPGFQQTDRHPVVGSWQDAEAYVKWLERETGKPYRLPSEAEWEYAARAGTTTPYAFGNAITPKDANYSESKLGKTTEVGSYPPNAWGLHDMHGNVLEWVEDVYHDSYEGAPPDGSAWIDSEGVNSSRTRGVRGGSWNDASWALRSACRSRFEPDDHYSNLGFRVALTLD